MIEGEKVRLVALSEKNLPTYRRWVNDPEVADFLASMDFPVSMAEEREWLERAIAAEGRDVHFTIVTKLGKPVGNIALMDIHCINRSAQLGIFIGEKGFWGKGYGEDAVRALLGFAFGTMGLNRVELRLNERNGRALSCYRKCGFKLEGKKRGHLFYRGEYCNELIMGMLRKDWDKLGRRGKA